MAFETIPANVQAYWDARWWVFIHFGAPLAILAMVIASVSPWLQEWYESRDEKDSFTTLDLRNK